MSVLKTEPMVRCRYCGRPVVIEHLSTTQPDPDGSKLHALFKSVAAKAMCDDCHMKYIWYAANDRSEDFEKGLP